MASELEIIYPVASSNIYAIIRRKSDAKVWDNTATAWDSWLDGDIDDYDIALTDKSGDLYQADFPSDIASGRYRITYYLRTGATVAITDTVLASLDLQWDGAQLTSPGGATLSQYALTSLEGAKRQLRLSNTTWDTVLTEIINAITDKVERMTGRQFKARDHVKFLRSRTRTAVLENWPLIEVIRVATGSDSAISVQYTGSDVRATVSVLSDQVTLRSIATNGTATTDSLTFATYASTDALTTAIAAVSGWTATKIADAPSDELYPLPATEADTLLYLAYPGNEDTNAIVDLDRGTVVFTWSTRQQAARLTRSHSTFDRMVKYNAGYATIPDALDQLARELVADAFRQGTKDRSIQSESLGDYSYTLAERALSDDLFRDQVQSWSDVHMGAA